MEEELNIKRKKKKIILDERVVKVVPGVEDKVGEAEDVSLEGSRQAALELGQNDPRKKYEGKPTIPINYCFLIHFENLYTNWDSISLLLASMDVVQKSLGQFV